ncbi:hypothetical protein [Oceanisphaera sp. IT1-181]|uniref:hypothetical protein n=1 Tax=Oceanisphaera sp. IT1-181 TaxID=3081199 RepID=UPI0029C9E88D|nr:hypothetical protein [Oceanisphaera sp. IT1-181]
MATERFIVQRLPCRSEMSTILEALNTNSNYKNHRNNSLSCITNDECHYIRVGGGKPAASLASAQLAYSVLNVIYSNVTVAFMSTKNSAEAELPNKLADYKTALIASRD